MLISSKPSTWPSRAITSSLALSRSSRSLPYRSTSMPLLIMELMSIAPDVETSTSQPISRVLSVMAWLISSMRELSSSLSIM